MSCDGCRFKDGKYCNARIAKDEDEMIKQGCINPKGTKYTMEEFNQALEAFNLFNHGRLRKIEKADNIKGDDVK